MKKFLKYLSIIILFIVSVFFSIGIIVPSINFESSVTVNKPAEQSFSVFISPFLLSEWIPGLKNVRWISGKQNEIGSKWEMTIEDGEDEYAMTEELVAFKENELFVVKMENYQMINNMEIRFSGRGATTEITSSNKITAKNIFNRSLFVFYQSKFKKRNAEMYNRLKKVIEIAI